VKRARLNGLDGSAGELTSKLMKCFGNGEGGRFR
jgi:hypothetical protein